MAKNNSSKKGLGGIDGILGGLSEILEKLGDIADKGEDISHSGSFGTPGEEPMKGVYGFSVKFGIGGKGPTVEPFGNIRKDRATGKSSVHEVREPMVDIFEEDDHTLIVAEMPGIGAEDIQIEIQDDLLTLSAQKGEKKFRKEILLPRAFTKEQLKVVCNNGVVEIRCNHKIE